MEVVLIVDSLVTIKLHERGGSGYVDREDLIDIKV